MARFARFVEQEIEKFLGDKDAKNIKKKSAKERQSVPGVPQGKESFKT